MPRMLLILALVAVAFWVVTVVDCAVQPPIRHRGVRKSAWLLIVVLLPVLGGVLWFTVGRARASQLTRSAPDDDPEFLGSLGEISDQDERIRRLEEELAQLDAEDRADPHTDSSAATSQDETTDAAGIDDDDSRDQRGARG